VLRQIERDLDVEERQTIASVHANTPCRVQRRSESGMSSSGRFSERKERS
jgi:hypothetical protein